MDYALKSSVKGNGVSRQLRSSKMKAVHGCLPVCLASALLVALVLIGVFEIQSLAPFGGGRYTLATEDANNQYLDFFAYLKDILEGKNSGGYTFSKGLGGNAAAVVSYYLMSPFNLLVVFFAKSQLISFYDLLVLLKLTTAGLTMAVYLSHRFDASLDRIYVVLLSVSYALMQYGIEQARNVMWLDGVYMLPLMALGVYYFMNRRKPLTLVLSTGFALIFNWYAAVLNGLLLVLLFVIESVAKFPQFQKEDWREVRRDFAGFVVSGIVGIALSAVVLVPTLLQFAKGRGKTSSSGSPWPFLGVSTLDMQGFVLGAHSEFGSASLFIGELALFGFVGFLCNRCCARHVKIAIIGVVVFIVLSFHVGVFYSLFSLMQPAVSYLYRYAYLAMFIMIVASAIFFRAWNKLQTSRLTYVVFGALMLVLVVLECLRPINGWGNTALTVVMSAVVILIALAYRSSRCGNAWRKGIGAMLIVVCLADLGCNAALYYHSVSVGSTGMITVHAERTDGYARYVSAEDAQIRRIQRNDKSVYRIAQTSTRQRDARDGERDWEFNEGFAYGYYPIISYTSDPDANQQKLLDNLGYGQTDVNINVVRTSILPTDSLLGAKYVLSSYPIEGLKKTGLPKAAGKTVYTNPYALPLAFSADKSADAQIAKDGQSGMGTPTRKIDGSIISDNNPFVYQNRLYSALVGHRVEVFKPVHAAITVHKGSERYRLTGIDEGSPVYGMVGGLKSHSVLSTKLAHYKYSTYGGPTVVYVPQNGDGTADVSLQIEDNTEHPALRLFYSVDLQALKQVAHTLKKNAPTIEHIDNGDVVLSVDAKHEEQVVTSITANPSWQVMLDGKPVNTGKVAGSLMSVPVTPGHHTITMHYRVAGVRTGVAISLVALIAVIGFAIFSRQKRPVRGKSGN